MSNTHLSNPFSLTKANDLSDDQIQDLWVDIAPVDSPDSLFGAGRFASPMPTYILGGKGSGKTHLMRYASFVLQKKRFVREELGLLDGVRRDGYVGIYTLCSGLETGRFEGKGQSTEAWLEIFSYYLELSLGVAALRVVQEFTDLVSDSTTEEKFCVAISNLFDIDAPKCATIADLVENLEERRKNIDFLVNDAAFTGELKPRITITRGRLIFGVPQIARDHLYYFENVLFAYQLDELETLTEDQQRHVNTLVRDRRGPSSLKIGARQFGIKTYETLGAREVNIKDSEYEELRLDRRFRQNEKTYRELVVKLVERRLENFWPRSSTGNSARGRRLADWFEDSKPDPFSPIFLQLVKSAPSALRAHMDRLRIALVSNLSKGDLPGIDDISAIDHLLTTLAVTEFPLLEKLNTTLLFNAWAKNLDLMSSAESIQKECSEFINTRNNGKYKQKLDHYKSDLVAQMYRAASIRQVYGGLDTFTRMSEGQLRALITLLKQTFDWATFQGERPFESGTISLGAESKGALAASEWFYNSMKKAGDDGPAILIAVDRLAELFRINRYADNPIECSLIGFSASQRLGSQTAQRILQLAVDYSFLVEILGGQQERNSEQITGKYQLNRMLVPKWGLPTGRRGIKPLSEFEMNAIFDPSRGEDFEQVAADWSGRMNAPFDRARRPLKNASGEETMNKQNDLFSS